MQITDDSWHHFVLTINRTLDNASVFIDGDMLLAFSATQLSGISGAMYLGGNGFVGHIDEFAVFEQALPRTLVESADEMAFVGDEMGLMGYLPFEELYLNSSGVLQQRFSVNDQRIYKDPNGKVVEKVVPLILSDVTEAMQDHSENAPLNDHGQLTKLRFDWSFNNDELMINILNQDYEVNKQSIYITVRDVEDLNGNPMASPVTWTAYVDRNPLKWSSKQLEVKVEYDANEDSYTEQVRIINASGMRHTFTIESLPQWIEVDKTYGVIDPQGELTVTLKLDRQIAIGVYSDLIYLTDEDGLSEPLQIEYIVEAIPPYSGVGDGPLNMSVCAQVKINTEEGTTYDFDENDIVYAIYRNECVGMANVTVNTVSNSTDVYLTVLGNDEMNRKPIHFQLWQASTGKVFDLTASQNVLFAHGFVYGCGEEEPLILTASGSERQQISLHAGWNWASVNLDLSATQGDLATCMTAAKNWTEGDLIKDPYSRLFSTYDEASDAFVGTLQNVHFSKVYMFYSANENTMRVSGEKLSEDSMHVSVRGDGQWSPLPCLFDQRTSVTEALADYYQNASVGDMVKAHNRFATFSSDKRWVGDLTALQPGEGYLFRRLAPGTVDIAFYREANSAPRRQNAPAAQPSAFTNPQASTNMTMIAKVEGLTISDYRLEVFVGDEKAAEALPIDSLYFLTIQSDRIGELRFEMDGDTYVPVCGAINYTADSHHGTLNAPIELRKEDHRPYKIIENNHVVIIRNNEKYDVTGKKL